jgi:hypothetical protein
MASLETQIGFSVLVGAHLRGPMTGGDGWDGWTKVGRSFGAKRRRPPNVPDRRRPLCVLLFLVGRRLAADGAASSDGRLHGPRLVCRQGPPDFESGLAT